MDEATARSATQELWPTLSHPEMHWMVAMSLAAGIADSPSAVWANRNDGVGYLVVGAQLYVATPTNDDTHDEQSFSLTTKPLSSETWTAVMKSEAAQASLGGYPGLRTHWEFRCEDGETLTVDGEVFFPGRELPGEMNKAELFARQVARQLGWHTVAPSASQGAP
jgi:hypothetical protein